MHAISISHLGKTFEGGKRDVVALKGVTLQIEQGEIFGLLGPNGAGKTTLISVLAGTTSPDAGKISVFGKDIVRELHDIQQTTNVVRGFGNVLERCTTLALMRYYALLYDVKAPEARIEALLRRLGLWERRHQHVSTFSSGWRQRFFIAKALLNDPKLLLLDEPTVGLDVDAAIRVRELIREFKQEGRTVLLTTHYMLEADELCDRIALISDGGIVAQGTSAELKRLVRKEEAIRIEGDIGQDVIARLRELEGVLGVTPERGGARVLVRDHAAMPLVLALLGGLKARVSLVRIEEPTLEDVFLKLTKRGLGATEEGDGD